MVFFAILTGIWPAVLIEWFYSVGIGFCQINQLLPLAPDTLKHEGGLASQGYYSDATICE